MNANIYALITHRVPAFNYLYKYARGYTYTAFTGTDIKP